MTVLQYGEHIDGYGEYIDGYGEHIDGYVLDESLN